MKHFAVTLYNTNGTIGGLVVAKFTCRKASTAQTHATKLLADQALAMLNFAVLSCGDGQNWHNIGDGWKRVTSRSHW